MVHGVAKSQTWLKWLSTGLGKWVHCMQTPLKPDDLRKAKSERSRRLRSRDLAETAQGLSGPQAALSTSEMLWKSFSSDTARGHYLASNPVKYPSCIAPFTRVFESAIKDRCDNTRAAKHGLFTFSDEKSYEQGPCLQNGIYSSKMARRGLLWQSSG